MLGGTAPGAGLTWRRLEAPAGPGKPSGKTPPITFGLAAPVTLTARVVKTDGSPAGGVRVAVQRLQPPASAGGYAGPAARPEWLIPPSVLTGLFSHTAPDGRYRIDGLPPRAEVDLAFPENAQPAEGTPVHLRLGGPGVMDAGLMVTVRPGSIEARVQMPGGQPLAGASLRIRRRWIGPSDPLAQALSAPMRNLAAGSSGAVEADAQGLLHLEGLPPGQYELALRGKTSVVDVPEGAAARPDPLVATVTPLSGRIVDAAQRPVEGVRVSVEIGKPKLDWPPGPEAPATSDAQGNFTLPEFPWEASLVVVRAVSGNALAEWEGNPATLRGPLTLALRAAALVTVKGRALNAAGAALAQTRIALFNREGARPQAFATTITDAQGQFEVEGLPRGERFAVGALVEGRPAESAYHVSPESGETLDLGDTRLAPSPPSANPAELTPAQLADAFALVSIPPHEALLEARDAAFRYLQSLRSGNVGEVHRLTSRLSPSYHPETPVFLRQQSLVLPPEASGLTRDALHPVAALPRLVLLLLFGAIQDPESRNTLLAALERPDWAVIGYRASAGVNILLVAHREAGGWKAVGGIQSDPAALSTAKGDQSLFGVPYPAPPAVPVLSAATRYLEAWRRDDSAALHLLTSPLALHHDRTLDGFRKKWQARPDAGKAPTGIGAAARPEQDTRFSQWDLAALFSYPAIVADVRAGKSATRTMAQFPYPQIAAGDVAVARYSTGEKQFLMLLVRRAGRWEVFEPALPV
ncbi:MAG TPA: carboxypeptidase-like regulatory domain-containing protein [Armatimonadota bacterium]|nr:carboxypeptidase-like regulatory domain-containing protein [Armatimonadota bacterium]